MNKEGIKYDKGKPRVAEMVKDFGPSILEVAKVWAFGADKYEKSNWKLVDNAEDRYTNALLRHLIAEEDNPIDFESGLLHATHVAWNALARLYFILRKQKPKAIDYINDFFDCNKVMIYEDVYQDKKIEPLD